MVRSGRPVHTDPDPVPAIHVGLSVYAAVKWRRRKLFRPASRALKTRDPPSPDIVPPTPVVLQIFELSGLIKDLQQTNRWQHAAPQCTDAACLGHR